MDYISRFDASEFPTKFAAQVRECLRSPGRSRGPMVVAQRHGQWGAPIDPDDHASARRAHLRLCLPLLQIKDFDVGDLVDKKNARRYDDCLSYTMVASKKVGLAAPHRAAQQAASLCPPPGCGVSHSWAAFCRWGLGSRSGCSACLACMSRLACISRAAVQQWACRRARGPACSGPPRAQHPLPAVHWLPLLAPLLLRCAAQALQEAGLEKGANPDGHGSLDKTRVGVLVGSGMGGLTGEAPNAGCTCLASAACSPGRAAGRMRACCRA